MTDGAPSAPSAAARIALGVLVGLLAGFVAGRLASGAGAAAGPAAPAPDRSAVLATVGDETLTAAELDERWKQLSPDQKSFHGQQAREDGLASARAHFLEEVVDEIVLAREARRRGLHERPDIRAAVRACANRVVARPLLAREVREAALPRSELEAWYAENSEQFGKPLRVEVREIVVTAVTSGPGDATPDAAAARARAEDLAARARAGEDFAQLATSSSEAPSARYGGYVGWVEAGRISRPFEERALQMQAGEVSEVLDVPEGFAVLKAEARQEATIPPLDDVQDLVLERLLSDDVGALQRRYNVFVRGLREQEGVVVHRDRLGQDAPAAATSVEGGAGG